MQTFKDVQLYQVVSRRNGRFYVTTHKTQEAAVHEANRRGNAHEDLRINPAWKIKVAA